MKSNLFKNRTFTLFVIGSIITLMGDNFFDIALALYVLKITGSAAKFSFILTLTVIPTIFLGPVAGVLVDRISKKKILILFDIIRGCILVFYIIYGQISTLDMTQIYIMAVLFGICSTIYQPCTSTIMPAILDKKDLVQGNTIYRTALQIGQVIAPTLATIIYSAFGIYVVMCVDAVTYFLMALIAVTYKFKPTKELKPASVFNDIKSGFTLFKNKEILSLGLNGLASYLLVLPIFSVGMPFIVKDIFNGSDQNYSSIQTVISISSILIVFTIPYINKKMNQIKALDFTMVGMLFGITLLLPLSNSAVSNYFISNHLVMVIYLMVVAFVFYLSFSNYGVYYLTVNQEKVDHRYLGRYNSILLMLFAIGNAIGCPIFGFLFDTKHLLYPIGLAIIGMVIKLLLNRMVKPIEEKESETVA